jgi:PAS domain S-box-containing protein
VNWDLTYTMLGIIATSGTIIAALWKGKRPALRALETARSIINLPSDVAEGRKEIEAVSTIVKKELTPNGGGSMRDIVNRMETRFSAGDARLRAVLSQMEVAIWESDEMGNCTYVSRAMCRLTGYTDDESIGRGWISTIDPSDRARVVAEWSECVRDARDFKMAYAFMRPSGERVDVLAEATVLRDPKGRAFGFVGSVEVVGGKCP